MNQLQQTEQQHGGPQEGPQGGPQGGPQKPLVSHKVFDRQIRLWGLEAQKKLLEARVLIVGLSAINAEASKNLALAGVSQTLCDDRPWNKNEVSFNFLPALESVDAECSTAEASQKGLESIAYLVSFSSRSSEGLGFADSANPKTLNSNLEALVRQYTCICVAAEMYPTHTLGPLAEACRKCGVGLIASQCCGDIGFFIQDFGSYQVMNKNAGEETTMTHPYLMDVLSAKLGDLDRKVDPAVFALLGLLRWESRQQKAVKPLGSMDPLPAAAAAEIEKAAAAEFACEGLAMTPQIHRALRDLAAGYNHQANATAAVTGGLLAQELRKYITREQKAVPNVVVFDGVASCAAVASVPPPHNP